MSTQKEINKIFGNVWNVAVEEYEKIKCEDRVTHEDVLERVTERGSPKPH